MKILALSDVVSNFIYSTSSRERYADVDLVIGCGDLPYYYLEFIVNLLDVPVYYVRGNHDNPRQYRHDGSVVDGAEGCQILDDTVVCFRRGNEKSGLLLAGLGGSVRYRPGGHYQYTQGQMYGRVLRLAPRLVLNRLRFGRYLDILVTHSPPQGIHDCPDRTHIGFQAFLRLMAIFKPRYLLHGHTHLYRPDTVRTTRYLQTEVLNVYPYRLVELETG